jgi:hypothetical protein
MWYERCMDDRRIWVGLLLYVTIRVYRVADLRVHSLHMCCLQNAIYKVCITVEFFHSHMLPICERE